MHRSDVHDNIHNHAFFLRANAFAERLRLGLAVIHGEPKDMVDTEDDDGRNSPPPDEGPKESSTTPSKSGGVETNYTCVLDSQIQMLTKTLVTSTQIFW